MRFLVDENLPNDLVQVLAEHGHDARHALDKSFLRNDSLTLSTLARAGHVLGREIRLELV